MQQLKYVLPLAAAVALAGCGSSSSSSEDTSSNTTTKFTKTATWTFEQDLTQEKSECFDFDTNLTTSCTGTAWDIKIVHGNSGSATPKFYTNSGTSATSANSQGAAMGSPFDYSWAKLKGFTDGNLDELGATVPDMAFMTDGIDNAFTDSLFKYDFDTFRMNPTYQVFVVTTDSNTKLTDTSTANTAFAVQAINYYGGSTGITSGHIKLRWVDITDNSTVHEASIDSSSFTDWVYFDLVSGSVINEAVANATNWQLAFKRYDVKTNSGISTRDITRVGTFKGPAATDSEETSFTALATSDWGWGARSAWGTDAIYSSLNPASQGAWPSSISFGFYTYYPTDDAGKEVGLTQHMIGANPENGVMLRSGDGDTYARMRITEINYGESADDKPYNGQRTYTIEFDVTE